MTDRDLPNRAWFPLAIGFPLVLLLLHWNFGHSGDIATFRGWCEAAVGGGDFYADGPGINYPVLGVGLACLPAALRPSVLLDADAFAHALKAWVAVAEIAVIFATAWLAGILGVRRPRLLAIAVGVLPSAWAGGAWFGQIDPWNTLWLLLAAGGAARWVMEGWRPGAAIAVAGVAAALLTKQLAWLSLPILTLLLAYGLMRRPQDRGFVGGVALATLPFFVLPDLLWLSVPEGWDHHLQFILFGGGSSHGELLSANGANFWGWATVGTSNVAAEWRWGGMTAWTWGWIAWVLAHTLLLGWLTTRIAAGPDEVVRATIVAVGLSNLTMAVWLTGVHERYLVHGAPFLLVGLAAGGLPGRWLQVAAWFVCGWSGLFVLSSIHFDTFVGVLGPFRAHTLTGELELGLWLAAMGALVLHTIRTRRGEPTP